MNRRAFLRNGIWLLAAPALVLPGKSRAQSRLHGAKRAGFASGLTVAAGGGTVTLVQSKWSRGSSGSQAVTLTSVQNGNMVIVVATVNGTSPTVAAGTCSDGVASYALDNKSAVSSTFYIQASWSRVVSATGSLTITLTPGGTIGAINMCAYEVSNLPIGAFDVASKGNSVASDQGTSTTPTTSTFTTAGNGIILATEIETSGGAGITHTAGTNFSISDSGAAHEDDNSGAFQSGCSEHRVVTTGALTNTTATVTIPSQSWLIRAFAYK